MDGRDVERISRRDFIKGGVAAGLLVSAGGSGIFAADETAVADVWAIKGTDKAKMMAKCLEIINANGGFGTGAKKLALKVNAAWDRTPDQAANTNPELVDAFLAGARDFGIAEISVPEMSCHPAKNTFLRSGIYAAATKHKAEMIDLNSDASSFVESRIERGVALKKVPFSRYFLDADVVVNMPVAKHHGAAGLTIAMKNWMGAVRNRSSWHKNDLHQCIADISTFIRPRWTIVDALKVMLDSGPQGPAKELKEANQIVLSNDQVAADAYVAANIFPEKTAARALYISKAGGLKAGVADLDRMRIVLVEV